MHFLCLGFYFLPTILAAARRSHATAPIFVVNLLTGWTGIGWLATVIWAMVSRPRWYPYEYTAFHYDPRYAPYRRF